MKIRILGSGGFLPTPLPLCDCKLCKEYHGERIGPSIYIDDLKLLIDTPEGIYTKVRKEKLIVSHVLYSHWHFDHTSGYRLFEYLNYVLNYKKPTLFLNNILYISFEKQVPAINYYENRKFLKITKTENDKIKIKNTTIHFMKMNNDFSVAYLIKSPGKNILICMDHCKDLILTDIKVKIDLLIMNLGRISKKNNSNLQHNTRESNESDFYKDNLRIIKEIRPTKTVLIHIEPLWNLSPIDLKDIEKKYSDYNISFAFDGMILNPI